MSQEQNGTKTLSTSEDNTTKDIESGDGDTPNSIVETTNYPCVSKEDTEQFELTQNHVTVIDIPPPDREDGRPILDDEKELISGDKSRPPEVHPLNVASEQEIGTLSTADIKKHLNDHSINFESCFEKEELVDKLTHLWKELNKGERAGDVPEADRCLICMDARIDCVLIECGHMVTCNECAKNIKDCPVCRMYVTRVVRVFKS